MEEVLLFLTVKFIIIICIQLILVFDLDTGDQN